MKGWEHQGAAAAAAAVGGGAAAAAGKGVKLKMQPDSSRRSKQHAGQSSKQQLQRAAAAGGKQGKSSASKQPAPAWFRHNESRSSCLSPVLNPPHPYNTTTPLPPGCRQALQGHRQRQGDGPPRRQAGAPLFVGGWGYSSTVACLCAWWCDAWHWVELEACLSCCVCPSAAHTPMRLRHTHHHHHQTTQTRPIQPAAHEREDVHQPQARAVQQLCAGARRRVRRRQGAALRRRAVDGGRWWWM